MSVPSSTPWPHIHWLDADTVLVLDQITWPEVLLAEEEQRQANEMTPPRRREFAAGRALARRASSLLLGRSVSSAIPVGAAGEPVWPWDLRGSISHTETHVAVIVARGASHVAVGIDLDDRRLIGARAAADLMTDEEIEAVRSLRWASDMEEARNIVFSAKESLFKYQYPLTGNANLDFDEVRVHLSPGEGFLRASPVTPELKLDAALQAARIHQKEIQGLRLCWVLPVP